ncbi:M35 family metallopeptidase [Pseudomonas mucidolens]|nr:M35 family metallopeptidase [Pseudomonas mucidolens]
MQPANALDKYVPPAVNFRCLVWRLTHGCTVLRRHDREATMNIANPPLLFPEILRAHRLDELNAPHELTQADLDWLHHTTLPSHALRSVQVPAMTVETLTLEVGGKASIPLAGCLVISAPGDHPAFLYTPYGGIVKFDSPESVDQRLDEMLSLPLERDDLFRLLSISQRNELHGATTLEKTRRTVHGDVFKTQLASMKKAQDLNDRAMVSELLQAPSLATMLDRILNDKLSNFDHKQARVSLNANKAAGDPKTQQWSRNMPLSDAILTYFHHQGWPGGCDVEFFHPDINDSANNTLHWQTIVKLAARNLLPRLTDCLDAYWDAKSFFNISRRHFLSQFISDRLRSTIIVEREKGYLTDAQSRELHRLFRPSRPDETLMFIETVRLWEYKPHSVELAGTLMISANEHYLYLPSHGFKKVEHHLGFSSALLGSPFTAKRKHTLYSLLSIEERNRFLRFDVPQISGKGVSPPVSESLAGAIIAKQLENLGYALEMSRQDDIDIHALVDKALDIRTLINDSLLDQKAEGHWGTRPAFYANLPPSNFMVHLLQRKLKTYASVQDAFDTEFRLLSHSSNRALRNELRELLSKLCSSFSLGIREEAELRELNGTLSTDAHNLIKTVFAFDPDYPEREKRASVKGFRPDVYSLKLTCTSEGARASFSAANCFLLTERGGLDTPFSGMVILWIPSDGLRLFSSVAHATQQLNHYLLDSRRRFGLLANLTPAQRNPHARYQLEAFELIEGNVLMDRMSSFIEHFAAEHEYLRALKIGDWQLARPEFLQSLNALLSKGAPTNLQNVAYIARANRRQHTLPGWLGTASLEDQHKHIELLEQYRNSVDDNKDYLDGIEPLRTYVARTLKTLLEARFPGTNLDPATLLIAPKLALAGPASSLTDFALNPIDTRHRTGFKISSTSRQKLPDNLNESAITQILLSLDISTTYRGHVLDKLSSSAVDIKQRKHRFYRQLPWQLLQHAHARYLQQYLSPTAFSLISQVLDMPDSIARLATETAKAIIRPLELITTEGAEAVTAPGLYLIGSSVDAKAPHVLYSPYNESHDFTEFADEASIIAAFNTPGSLQDRLIRLLPESQQATFRNLFASTAGHLSEITLASNPISDLLGTLFNDNITLLADMLKTQTDTTRQFDWQTVVHLFSTGIRALGRELPGKLTFIETLKDAYDDFKASSEALREHDWGAGLHNFIAGAAEMVSLGWLNRDDTFGLLDPVSPAAPPPPAVNPTHWQSLTGATRTDLQAFEAIEVSLLNLKRHPSDGTYQASASGIRYAPVLGKVFQVAKAGHGWRIIHEHGEGPMLKHSPKSGRWTLDPAPQSIRYGKVMSRLNDVYSDRQAGGVLNIEARGMAQIRSRYPGHANMIVQAVDTARYYSINALHNLEQVKDGVHPGSRLDTVLKTFLGVRTIDAHLVKKIHTAVAPICQALADPSWEQRNGSRIVIGSLRYIDDHAVAFVLASSKAGRIYLTHHFFNMGLDWYKTAVPDTFNVDAHAQGATLIHELSHLLCGTLDIVYLGAFLPYLDLISTVTHLGQEKYNEQKDQQLNAFSWTTPRARLFKAWDRGTNSLKSLDLFPNHRDTVRKILEITGTTTLHQARDVFLDPRSSDLRIDVMLRNADSLTLFLCELGRQLDPIP